MSSYDFFGQYEEMAVEGEKDFPEPDFIKTEAHITKAK
jgi:hypothetical protein